jgi:hypothetical protein
VRARTIVNGGPISFKANSTNFSKSSAERAIYLVRGKEGWNFAQIEPAKNLKSPTVKTHGLGGGFEQKFNYAATSFAG